MNDSRRKIINKQWHAMLALAAKLSVLKAEAYSIKEALEAVRANEQEAFDNLSEGLQQAERGQNMEQAIQYLDTAIDAVDTLAELDDLEEAMSALDDAEHC